MYCTNCGKEIGESALFCQFCGARATPLVPTTYPRRLERLRFDKKIAGVAGGVARYFDLDPTVVRVLWLVCVLLAGTGLLVYVVLWIALPQEPEYRIASAQGQP